MDLCFMLRPSHGFPNHKHPFTNALFTAPALDRNTTTVAPASTEFLSSCHFVHLQGVSILQYHVLHILTRPSTN